MRTAAILLLFLCSGCITTQTTRRVALAAIPSAPAGISGSPGVGLTMRVLTGTPQSRGEGGAMAFPIFQPELGAVLQLGEHSFVGGKLAIGSADFGAQSPPGVLPVPGSSTAFDLGVGGGHDFSVSSIFGVSISGEIGLAGVALTTAGFTTETHVEILPAGRIAAGVYAAPGAFRVYAGATVGTSAINDATSIRTQDCTGIIACTTTETGFVSVSAVGMLGGGVRWQGNSFVSLGVEGWMPLSETGTRLPFTFSFTLRLFDFVVKPRPRPPAPPPPELTPEPELPLPQI